MLDTDERPTCPMCSFTRTSLTLLARIAESSVERPARVAMPDFARPLLATSSSESSRCFSHPNREKRANGGSTAEIDSRKSVCLTAPVRFRGEKSCWPAIRFHMHGSAVPALCSSGWWFSFRIDHTRQTDDRDGSGPAAGRSCLERNTSALWGAPRGSSSHRV